MSRKFFTAPFFNSQEGGAFMKMTKKQKRFCDEYLIDLNATQACIKAGYSKKTARQTRTENLSKPYRVKGLQLQIYG